MGPLPPFKPSRFCPSALLLCPCAGRYGGCVGDLPPYDAFTLGGPYSVRGYTMGELGAARRVLEVCSPSICEGFAALRPMVLGCKCSCRAHNSHGPCACRCPLGSTCMKATLFRPSPPCAPFLHVSIAVGGGAPHPGAHHSCVLVW